MGDNFKRNFKLKKMENIKIKFLTEIKKGNKIYAGYIFASNLKQAKYLARQKGEKVIGHIPLDCNDCVK